MNSLNNITFLKQKAILIDLLSNFLELLAIVYKTSIAFE
ncbi:hypothetical protein H1P_300003 [Hyella patelloides LEGE 07179]|uniref:Uncharacterized protein n=1 Tax=Hyella patelloides LEGE 07179 TaxID=945734 RepID=A0A563VUN1_9CYAN|nr:hypothetical protein H1P_300003 [Hyella patelloides LEGE 07179]